MSTLALLLMRALHWLPLPMLRMLGATLGSLLYRVARARRHVAEVNLRLCFPDLDDAQRDALVRATFVAFGQSVTDRALLWHSSAGRLRKLVTLSGEGFLDQLAGQPVILLAPHFVGMDAAWTRLSLARPAAGTYARQTNPAFDRAMYAGRTRFGGIALARQDGVRAALRELKNGLPLYYLPDMDFGARDAVFVPFFGVPAATVTAVPRLARLTGAKVLPVVTRMTPQGYEVTIHAPWDAFPGPSDDHAVRRMNAFIEGEVRCNIGQYHWLHKRFKTRPEGEAGVY